jgi:hypothetical protein
MTAATRRGALRFSVAAFAAGLAVPTLAAMPATTANEAEADLIRACNLFAEAAFGSWYRYVLAPDDVDDQDTPPDWDTYHRIIATQATTPEGWRAKALAYVAWDREAYDDHEDERTPVTGFLASLLRNLVAPARAAIIADLRAKYGPLPHHYTADGVWIGYSPEEKAAIAARHDERIAQRAAEQEAAEEAAVARARERYLNQDPAEFESALQEVANTWRAARSRYLAAAQSAVNLAT